MLSWRGWGQVSTGHGQCQGQGQKKKINVRGLNASIFVILFFNMPKISRAFYFFALEHPKIKCKGRTARTTVSCTVRMNTGRVVSHSGQYKQEIDPF